MNNNLKHITDFSGISTAIITPFNDDQIDYDALENLINMQIAAKIDAIIIAGSTGEVHSLEDCEYDELLQKSARMAQNKIKIIAGIGFNNTNKCIRAASIAHKYNYDAVLAITPYYNKPSQAGLIQHYSKIHDNTNLPIILYSAPSRTGIDFTSDTIIELSKLARIIAFKDSGSDISRSLDLTLFTQSKLQLLCGDDINILAYSANGGVGCVSVLANILPSVVKDVYHSIKNEDYKLARLRFLKYAKICQLLFIETNPAPIKYCLSLLGLCKENLRLPLCSLSESSKSTIRNELIKLKLIND